MSETVLAALIFLRTALEAEDRELDEPLGASSSLNLYEIVNLAIERELP
jgi:hypothetical protein